MLFGNPNDPVSTLRTVVALSPLNGCSMLIVCMLLYALLVCFTQAASWDLSDIQGFGAHAVTGHHMIGYSTIS